MSNVIPINTPFAEFLNAMDEVAENIRNNPSPKSEKTYLEPGAYYAYLPKGPHKFWMFLTVCPEMDGEWNIYGDVFNELRMDGPHAKHGKHYLLKEDVDRIEMLIIAKGMDKTLERFLASFPAYESQKHRLVGDMDRFRLARRLMNAHISPEDTLGFRRILEQSLAFKEQLKVAHCTKIGWEASMNNPLLDIR